MSLALITGARGFIGRHLARALHQQGISVCGIGHGVWSDSARENWGLDYWMDGEVSKYNLDIMATTMGVPDMVFHLAGGSSVGSSFSAPGEDFRRSVLSAAQVLEWARLAAPKVRLVFASSAAVYGVGHTQLISETARLTPYSPYGFHKRIAEELFESYSTNFGMNVAIVRLFSVYGQELRKQLLWDVCVRLSKNPNLLTLSGSGCEVRDWFHVSDAVTLLQLAEKNSSHSTVTVNGGTGIPTSVRQIAEQLCIEWGMSTQIKFSGNGRVGDPEYLVADTAFSDSWDLAPKIDWKTGVADYVSWFRRENN